MSGARTGVKKCRKRSYLAANKYLLEKLNQSDKKKYDKPLSNLQGD